MGRLMFRSASFVLVALCFLFMTDMALATVRTYKFVIHSKNVTKLCGKHNIITVNGQSPGPTLYAKNGDTLIVKVQNKAQENVTIHWHGVSQIRTGWSDGVEYITQCPITTGGSYTYRFTITGQEGTLWWHAHSSWLRATVYGALIIYPKKGTTYPFPKPSAETSVLLGEWWNSNPNDVVNEALRTGSLPNKSDAFSINGQPGDLYPCSSSDTVRVRVKKGETNLVRVINAALNTDLFFSIAKHKMTVVGVDASYTKPYHTTFLMVSPGQTTDVLITANKKVGKYYIAARAYSIGVGNVFDRTTTTAILEYEGSSSFSSPVMPTLPLYNDTQSATRFTNSLRSLNSHDHPSIFPRTVDESLFVTVGLGFLNDRKVTASMNNHSFVLPTSTSILQAYHFGINGVFTTGFPNNPPVEFDYTGQNISQSLFFPERGTKVKMLKYGTAVQVILQGMNIVLSESHPFHLHGFDFHIVGQGLGNYNPQTDPQKFNLVDPLQRNTAIVPLKGWVAIRFVADNPGVWFMHCHLEFHLTWGMGMAFIVENGPDEASSIEKPPADLPRC